MSEMKTRAEVKDTSVIYENEEARIVFTKMKLQNISIPIIVMSTYNKRCPYQDMIFLDLTLPQLQNLVKLLESL